MLKITINDAGLRTKLTRLDQLFPQIVQKGLVAIGSELELWMKLSVPVVTSNLKQNIMFQVTRQKLQAGVGEGAPYGKWVSGAESSRIVKITPFHEMALAIVEPQMAVIFKTVIHQETAGLR